VDQQYDQAVPDLAAVASPHAFDLLGEIFGIDVAELALAQQARLLLRPGEEIVVIGDRIAGHRRSFQPPQSI
jgi:hypothetical protein